jgi:hypothetical protein
VLVLFQRLTVVGAASVVRVNLKERTAAARAIEDLNLTSHGTLLAQSAQQTGKVYSNAQQITH